MNMRTHKWTVDINRDNLPETVTAQLGATLRLESVFRDFGRIVNFPEGATAFFFYQLQGMGNKWWKEPATLTADGSVYIDAKPRFFYGVANDYTFFFGVKTETDSAKPEEVDADWDYTANGTLRILHAPGKKPNTLQPPVETIDFSKVVVLNAPWLVEESDPLALPIAKDALAKAEYALSTKVDKIPGMELSSNDFTGAWIGRIESAEGDIVVVRNIAQGKNKAVVFDTKAQMDTWLESASNVEMLDTGDNLYIRDRGVPDYWWDGDKPLELETEKVDLTALLLDNAASADILPAGASMLLTEYIQKIRNWQKWAVAQFASIPTRTYEIIGESPAEWFVKQSNGDGTCTIIGTTPLMPNPVDIVIPRFIGGERVTAINYNGASTPFTLSTINSLAMESVETVSSYAFFGIKINETMIWAPSLKTAGMYSFNSFNLGVFTPVEVSLFAPSLSSAGYAFFGTGVRTIYLGNVMPPQFGNNSVKVFSPRGAWADISWIAGNQPYPYDQTPSQQRHLGIPPGTPKIWTPAYNSPTPALTLSPTWRYKLSTPITSLDLSSTIDHLGDGEASVDFTVASLGDVALSSITLPATIDGWVGDPPQTLDAGGRYILIINGKLAALSEVRNV